MIMQTNTLDDFSNTSGTEDFQQQNVPPSINLDLLLLTFPQNYYYELVMLFPSLGCVSNWLIHLLYNVTDKWDTVEQT